jgi:hypothetical protein
VQACDNHSDLLKVRPRLRIEYLVTGLQ